MVELTAKHLRGNGLSVIECDRDREADTMLLLLMLRGLIKVVRSGDSDLVACVLAANAFLKQDCFVISKVDFQADYLEVVRCAGDALHAAVRNWPPAVWSSIHTLR